MRYGRCKWQWRNLKESPCSTWLLAQPLKGKDANWMKWLLEITKKHMTLAGAMLMLPFRNTQPPRRVLQICIFLPARECSFFFGSNPYMPGISIPTGIAIQISLKFTIKPTKAESTWWSELIPANSARKSKLSMSWPEKNTTVFREKENEEKHHTSSNFLKQSSIIGLGGKIFTRNPMIFEFRIGKSHSLQSNESTIKQTSFWVWWLMFDAW